VRVPFPGLDASRLPPSSVPVSGRASPGRPSRVQAMNLVQSEEAVEHVAADPAQHVEGVVEVAQEHDAAVAGDEGGPAVEAGVPAGVAEKWVPAVLVDLPAEGIALLGPVRIGSALTERGLHGMHCRICSAETSRLPANTPLPRSSRSCAHLRVSLSSHGHHPVRRRLRVGPVPISAAEDTLLPERPTACCR
jgi:hypothetical protein